MEIILMRHAKAEEKNLIKYPNDELRPLTDDGKEIQKNISKAMKKIAKNIDIILTSPFLRAKQTAEITAFYLGLVDKMESTDYLGNDFTIENIAALIQEKSLTENRVLLIGHEPNLSQIAGYYLGNEINLQFKKSGIMIITFAESPHQNQGFLRSFYRPKELLQIFK